jgi:hypothetical protein
MRFRKTLRDKMGCKRKKRPPSSSCPYVAMSFVIGMGTPAAIPRDSYQVNRRVKLSVQRSKQKQNGITPPEVGRTKQKKTFPSP